MQHYVTTYPFSKSNCMYFLYISWFISLFDA